MVNEIALRRYHGGAVIFSEGEFATALYLLVRGSVEAIRNGTRISELGPGSVFGEMAALPGMRYKATARALGDALCVVVPGEKLPELGETLKGFF